MVEVLGVVVFKFWMKFYPKMGKKAPKMGLLGKKVPLYSNLLQGAVIIKTAVVFTPIRYINYNEILSITISEQIFEAKFLKLLLLTKKI